MKRLFAVVAALPLVACGTQPQGASDPRPALAVVHAQSALTPTFDVDCVPLLQQVIDDAGALQQTPAFKKLEATPEYKTVMDDAEALGENHCEDEDNATPACGGLRKQYAADEDKMMRTPEFQTVTATPEYKTLEKDVAEAQALGCMDE